MENKPLNDNIVSVSLYPGKLCDAINRISIKPARQEWSIKKAVRVTVGVGPYFIAPTPQINSPIHKEIN